MKRIAFVAVVALGISLGTAGVAEGQAACLSAPYPNGCSVLGDNTPEWLGAGLDAIFAGACDNHDECWSRCNGARGPYLGLAHRNQCDQTFLAEMSTACALRAGQLLFPLGTIENVGEFLAICEGAALAFFGVVQAVTPVYWHNQCICGCNPMACAQPGGGGFIPPTCGTAPAGHGFCYRQPYDISYCTFHNCPGFLTEPGEDPRLQLGEPEWAREPPAALTPVSAGRKDPGQEWRGGECTSILDWLCCACQWCPSCLV